jgi:Domain of unknown function (DUF4337)
MSDEVELDTHELRETLEELQEERKEREETERQASWTRYVALTTAILAVFAAIGAVQSASLVNESMRLQLKAADRWNEYQSARQKDHLFSVQAYGLLDRGVAPAPAPERASSPAVEKGAEKPGRAHAARRPAGSGAPAPAEARKERTWTALSPAERLRDYIDQVDHEARKETDLSHEAAELEGESGEQLHRHHRFAQSVAMIQIAIALSAVAALSRIKLLWLLSLVVGAGGVVLFAWGFLG